MGTSRARALQCSWFVVEGKLRSPCIRFLCLRVSLIGKEVSGSVGETA